jgi:arylsulfatase A-like enzyme
MDCVTSRRTFVKQLSAGAAAATLPAAARRKPNLVFVFSDQQSSDTLGCYGNRDAQTPNADRLAKEGVLFEHCISNSPLCTPYRGILVSGRHTLQNGAIENDIRLLPGDGNSLGEVLRDAGYRTGWVGKWHLYGGDRVRPIPAGPDRHGFDDTFLSNNCTVIFDKERAYYWNEKGERTLYGDWEPDAQTRQALQFIDDNPDDPFALFVSWHPPHNWASGKKGPAAGYAAPDEFLNVYDPAALHLRGNCTDTPDHREIFRGYLAMCTSVDRCLGWLLDKIDEKGLRDDTVFVFTSDHGDTARSHQLPMNKMRPEIESIRVPFLIRHPGVLEPRASDLLIGSLDLMPTLLGMLGVQAPDTCQGADLSQDIAQRRDDAVDSIPLWMFPLDWRGVYTRRYTYAFDTSAGQPTRYREAYFSQPEGLTWNCLFDRDADTWERRNLFDSADHEKVRSKLHDQTISWMDRFGDKGWPYRHVQERIFTEEDYRNAQDLKRVQRPSGLLRGRPSELLRAAPARVR